MSKLLYCRCSACSAVVAPENAIGLANIDGQIGLDGTVNVSLNIVDPANADTHLCKTCERVLKKGILGIEDQPATETPQ